jgi:hypothetical protein
MSQLVGYKFISGIFERQFLIHELVANFPNPSIVETSHLITVLIRDVGGK